MFLVRKCHQKGPQMFLLNLPLQKESHLLHRETRIQQNSQHVLENFGKTAVRTSYSRCSQGPSMGAVFSSRRAGKTVALACPKDGEGGRRRQAPRTLGRAYEACGHER